MIELLKYYLSLDFVRYAFITSVFIALSSSLLGVPLVLRRFSFIGDGLSHVAFFAMAVATALNVILKATNFQISNTMYVILPITIISAILLLRTSNNTKIKGDQAIAMISVGALSFGYLIMNLFPASGNISQDVCTTLFGASSILTLTFSDVVLSIILSTFVIIIFVVFYNKIFLITFDETFAVATGVNANAYNFLIATITAIVIVLAMNLVGSLLVSALIVFPVISSMRIFKTFKSVTIGSAIISVICAFIGLTTSILLGSPVGSTIVGIEVIVFIIFYVISFMKEAKYVK
ncbi:MAG: metal ABC transporter permease [Lachnospiraceae bacterium]|nr:metal ABC transporter permease [Lachnospiraceae bacterium]